MDTNRNFIMDAFEEDALLINSTPYIASIKAIDRRYRSYAIAIAITILIPLSVLYFYIWQHHQFISKLKKEGATVVTVSAVPAWVNNYISNTNPLISWIETIQAVKLTEECSTDENLKQLAECSQLTQVEMSGSNVTGDGLSTLGEVETLLRIGLVGCDNISNADVAVFRDTNRFIKVVRKKPFLCRPAGQERQR